MTALAAFALDDEHLLVVGGGRRWRVAVSVGDEPTRAARYACAAIRDDATFTDAPAMPGDTVLSSLSELMVLARTRDQVAAGQTASPARQPVRWSFGGFTYRLALPINGAVALAQTVTECLLATIADAQEARALVGTPLYIEQSAPSQRELPVAEQAHPPPPGVLLRWDRGDWRKHTISPPPLVDPVTGILHRITRRPPHPGAPRLFEHLHAEVPFLSSVDARNQPDLLAPAAGFTDGPESPEECAILSGIAHVCGADLGQGVRRWASAEELSREGHRVLTVAHWAPHDPTLHDESGFPFVRDTPELAQWWLLGHDNAGPRWAPLSLVHAGYRARDPARTPATHANNLVGLQAGRTLHDALDRAASHLIAQDAVARWWANPTRLEAAALPSLIRSAVDASPWRVTLLHLHAAVPVPVRLAVIDDLDDSVIALGYGCASTADEAGLRAIGEALIQHASARDLASPASLIRDSDRLGNGAVAGLGAFDADRRYASRVFADRRALIDPMCHVQYGLSPEVVAQTRALTRAVPSGAAPVAQDATLAPFDALEAARIDVTRVDVTTDRVRAAGAFAVRLLAPTLRRLSLGAFPDAHLRKAPPYPGW